MSVLDSGCTNSSANGWMLNTQGETPCQVLENVLKTCEAGASINNLSKDVSCESLGSTSSSACCCSTATYALMSACWVCQTQRPPGQLDTTYQSWWSGCPVDMRLNGSLPAVVISQSPPIPVPLWALARPSAGDEKWNLSSAQLAVGITPSPSSVLFPSTSTSAYASTISTTSSPKPSLEPSKDRPPYVPIAICSVLAIVLLFGMAAWIYRRRNRVATSSRADPGFDLDGDGRSKSFAQDEQHPGRWGWWLRKTGRDSPRKSQSNPDKIDAWRYPFAYEPVSSTGPSSGSGGSGQGPYYDPPIQHSRRNSEVHLGHQSSMDAINIRNQSSVGNLGQHYRSYSRNPTSTPGNSASTRTLATPSPMPGQYPPTPNHVQSNLPAQGHTLPPGVAVDHIRSLAYGSPQPPVYAQPIHYTYPYTSVPSATTTSPRSPQQVQSPTYTHRTQTQQPPTPRSRQSDQVLMIPASQVTPDQMEQLQLQFPELRLKVKKKRRRHRDGQGAETDREDRGRARAGTDADQFRNHAPAGGGRPRSTSVPAQAQTEEERDGPRNLVELMAKYEPRRRRHRDVVTINVGGGDGNRPVKVDSGAGHTRTENASRGGHERRASEIRGPRPRAVDGGVSIMGGPIRRNPQ